MNIIWILYILISINNIANLLQLYKKLYFGYFNLRYTYKYILKSFL